MWKEVRSLDYLFMFRESEKSLKTTPGGSFFVYPYGSEKEIKLYPTRSYIFDLENELRLCSWIWQGEKMIKTALKSINNVKTTIQRFSEANILLEKPINDYTLYKKWKFINSNTMKIPFTISFCIRICSSVDSHFGGWILFHSIP